MSAFGLIGRGATSDLSPQSASKRTLTASPSGRVKWLLSIGFPSFCGGMPWSSYQGATKAVQRESRYEIEENKARRYCLWQEWGCWPSTGSSATIPVSGLAWRKLRTWRRSGRCISVLRWRYQYVHDEARGGRENHQIGWGAMRRRPSPSGRQPMLPRAPAQVRARWSRRLSART